MLIVKIMDSIIYSVAQQADIATYPLLAVEKGDNGTCNINLNLISNQPFCDKTSKQVHCSTYLKECEEEVVNYDIVDCRKDFAESRNVTDLEHGIIHFDNGNMLKTNTFSSLRKQNQTKLNFLQKFSTHSWCAKIFKQLKAWSIKSVTFSDSRTLLNGSQSSSDSNNRILKVQQSKITFSEDEYVAYQNILPKMRLEMIIILLSVMVSLFFTGNSFATSVFYSQASGSSAGIISLAVYLTGFLLGSIISYFIIQYIQPFILIMISLVVNVLCLISKFQLSSWHIELSALFQGLTVAFIWNSWSTYIVLMSRGKALITGQDYESVFSYLFFVFILFFHSYYLPINIIFYSITQVAVPVLGYIKISFLNTTSLTDVTLFLPNKWLQANTLNQTMMLNTCDIYFTGSGTAVSKFTYYDEAYFFLMYLSSACIVISFIAALIGFEKIRSYASLYKNQKSRLLSLCRFVISRNFLLMFPIMVYSMMQFGFIGFFISEAFEFCFPNMDIEIVSSICFCCAAAVGCFIQYYFKNCVGHVSFLIAAAVINILGLLLISQWHQVPSDVALTIYFLLVLFWGGAHGFWTNQTFSLVGIMFADKFEEAFTGHRLAQGFGIAIGFILSVYVSRLIAVYFMLAFCIISVALYLTLEILLKRSNESAKSIVQFFP